MGKFFMKWIMAVLLAGMANLVWAEYQAVTELSAGKDENGNEVFKRRIGVDEVDIQACKVITDNINAMEKYHIDWACDFPISSNNYLLSKPLWIEITGKEKRKSQNIISPTAKIAQGDDPINNGVSIYGFSYNIDEKEGNEKIYSGLFNDFKCRHGERSYRVETWFAENNGLSLNDRFGKGSEMVTINSDIVIYSSRVYFVAYGSDDTKPEDFWVYTIDGKENHISNRTVCAVNKVK